MTEQSVQGAPDSTGKKVRTLEVYRTQPDGSSAAVEVQVVVLADENGKILTFSRIEKLLESILEKMEEIQAHMA